MKRFIICIAAILIAVVFVNSPFMSSSLMAQAYKIFSLKDDFGTSGASTSNAIGQLGWTKTELTVGGCANLEKYTGSWPNLGVTRITTNATSGNGCALSLGASGSSLLGNLSVNPGWAALFIVKLETTSSTKVRIGFGDDPGNASPQNGIWFRYNSLVDTFLTMETCTSGVCSTKVSTTIPSNDRFMKFWIYSVAAGQVLFNFDGREIAQPYSLNANVPTANMNPMIQIINNANLAQNLQIDYFLYAQRVSR